MPCKLKVLQITIFFQEEQTDVDSKKSEASSVISQRGLIANIGDATTEAEPPTGNKPAKPLKLKKKVYEFYGAPITKFWVHSVCYFSLNLVLHIVVLYKKLEREKLKLKMNKNYFSSAGSVHICKIGIKNL